MSLAKRALPKLALLQKEPCRRRALPKLALLRKEPPATVGLFCRRDLLAAIAIALEVEVQVQNASVECALEAAFVRKLPLLVWGGGSGMEVCVCQIPHTLVRGL